MEFDFCTDFEANRFIFMVVIVETSNRNYWSIDIK